jgi:broad specificity phosphatase PhoE
MCDPQFAELHDRWSHRRNAYFVLRHGHSQANERGLIASTLRNAGDAFGLTPAGRSQVEESVTAAREGGLLSRECRILSSPLLRTVQTATIASDLLGASVEVDARLVERGFGTLELASDGMYAQVWERDVVDPHHREWEVESVCSVLSRLVSLLFQLEETAEGTRFLLCTHGDVASVMLTALAGHPVGGHRSVGALDTAGLVALT